MVFSGHYDEHGANSTWMETLEGLLDPKLGHTHAACMTEERFKRMGMFVCGPMLLFWVINVIAVLQIRRVNGKFNVAHSRMLTRHATYMQHACYMQHTQHVPSITRLLACSTTHASIDH